MIADANDIECGQVLDCELCIIGAGAAGITLALQYEHRAERVIVLESGAWRTDAATESLSEGNVGPQGGHPPLQRYRRRVLGGATTLWGGRTVPFDPIDFSTRDWIPGSSWPISYQTLLKYYPQAAEICESGSFAYTVQEAFPRGMRQTLPGFHGMHFHDSAIERFSCPTNFAARYGRRLHRARHLLVLLSANAVRLHTAPGGETVSFVQVETLRGRHFRLRPRRVVLAAGGLETPRLLYASRDHHALGIGNAYDQLGRCYMTHIAGTTGEIVPAAGITPHHGYEIADDGVYCRRRFALTPDAQMRFSIGNFVARLHHPPVPDPRHGTGALSALYLAQPFILPEYAARLGDWPPPPRPALAHLRNIVGDAPGVLRFATHMTLRRRCATRKFPSITVAPRSRRFSLDFHAEHVPNPDSRVTITRERDAIGLPRLNVDWRASALDLRTVRLSIAALQEDFAASGVAGLSYDPAALTDLVVQRGAYGGHHIGTARMAASPRDGVVDSNCRVHGLCNLFVAGSAVFPTSSQANPTLTIVALALRLAAHLQAQ